MRYTLRKMFFPLMLLSLFFLSACTASRHMDSSIIQPSATPPPSATPIVSPSPEPELTAVPSGKIPAPLCTPVLSAEPEAAPLPSPEPVQPVLSTPPNTALNILMYHDFTVDASECNEWKTTADCFRADLQWLTDNGYSFVLPSELAAGISLPEKAVMITIDDGYASTYDLAFPIIKEFNAKAVISLIVAYQTKEGPGALSWDMCREMAESGLVEFGSHTYRTHDYNRKLNTYGIQRRPDETEEEYAVRLNFDIQRSIYQIEANLGQKVLLFAYPFGKTEPWAKEIIEDQFAVSLTTTAGRADISAGLYELPRYNINSRVHPFKYLK